MIDFILFSFIEETKIVQHASHSIFNIIFGKSHTRDKIPYYCQWNLSHFILILYEEVMTVLPETRLLTSFRTSQNPYLSQRISP
jgi:hypothetical protein